MQRLTSLNLLHLYCGTDVPYVSRQRVWKRSLPAGIWNTAKATLSGNSVHRLGFSEYKKEGERLRSLGVNTEHKKCFPNLVVIHQNSYL